jgi:2-polyprenyl-3-methyl-5-hydroxy-6-metoxy-1,4-benzoquinol methylase
MSKKSWSEIFADSGVLTGNVAKVKVLEKLHNHIADASELEILDIGCIGPQPLEFWEPLLIRTDARFRLTGIDVDGIEKAREMVARRGWTPSVTLLQGSGYDLENLFPAHSFDIVVATQVLEHVARIIPFMRQIETVLKAGGEAFFTLDSGHWQPRFDIQDPVRLAKNFVKKSLGSLGNERHYDLPWLDREIIGACNEVGLEVVDCRYFNLPPLKWIHNHLMPTEKKNAFMRLWLELEEFINDDAAVRDKVKNYFLVIYLQVRKGSTRSTSLSNAKADAVSQGSLIAS